MIGRNNIDDFQLNLREQLLLQLLVRVDAAGQHQDQRHDGHRSTLQRQFGEDNHAIHPPSGIRIIDCSQTAALSNDEAGGDEAGGVRRPETAPEARAHRLGMDSCISM